MSSERLFTMLKDTDDKHVAGHNRLRDDLSEAEARLLQFDKKISSHDTQLQNAMRRTTDISALRFTPAMVASIVFICASIVGGSYASTSGLRDSQADERREMVEIKAMLAAQTELSKANARLQDERAATMSEAIKEIKARGEMTDLKVNNLRETVLTTRRQ